MAEEVPTEEDTHPVATSKIRGALVRGLIVLVVVIFLASAAVVLAWMRGILP